MDRAFQHARDQGNCPDYDSLAHFLDKRLSEDEARLIAVHAAACKRCADLIEAGYQFNAELTPEEEKAFHAKWGGIERRLDDGFRNFLSKHRALRAEKDRVLPATALRWAGWGIGITLAILVAAGLIMRWISS